jgi:hypothetical protein
VDLVALIVAALAAGAGAAAQDETPGAVNSAYARLQVAVRQRLAGHPDGELAMAGHETGAVAGRALLAGALTRAGAGDDTDLVAAARALMELTDGAGKYAVPVSGSQGVQVGDHGVQVSYYFGEPAKERGTGAVSGREPAGRLLAEVTDPFALDVHRPVQADGPQPGLPLPPYVSREHDLRLAEVAYAAAEGASGIAVLVGESSTGKTRACWEVLGLLRGRADGWRLWHPIYPSRPEAALRELPSVGPRTVIWLNEAQFYLDAPDDRLGERVAAGLRELLRDPRRAPVLVLVTLWPSHWRALTMRPPAPVGPDPHAHARQLLDGCHIPIPGAFTPDQVRRLRQTGDVRLAAAAGARDGQVSQFLAGAPELLARYQNAPSAARALINAAMDARRLGMRPELSPAFLEAAAPGYLTDIEYDQLAWDEDWLEQALAYTAAQCNGVRGPLTRDRPRLSRTAVPAAPAAYRLADYLDQYGCRARSGQVPPAEFWAAAAAFAEPGDLGALAAAAYSRGLLFDAARLRKKGAARGDDFAAAGLIRILRSVHPDDQAPARWAAAHARLHNPLAVSQILGALHEAGADEQVSALADGAATQAAVDDQHAVRVLINAMREAGAVKQAAILATRAPGHADPDSIPADFSLSLPAKQEAGANLQAEFLSAHDPVSLGLLNDLLSGLHLTRRTVDALRIACAEQDPAVLTAGAAAHRAPGKPSAAGFLLGVLQEAAPNREASRGAASDNPLVNIMLLYIQTEGAGGQFVMLLDTDGDLSSTYPAHSRLSRLYARVLAPKRQENKADEARYPDYRAVRAYASTASGDSLATVFGPHLRAETPADQRVIALLGSAVTYADLDDPSDIAFLLDVLREAGADGQVAALMDRDPAAHVALDNPYGVAWLLDVLREAGADGQVAALMDRDPAAHVALDNPYGVTRLLEELRETDADRQVTILIDRLPAGGQFSLFFKQASHQERYRFGREPDGKPSFPWSWEDLD